MTLHSPSDTDLTSPDNVIQARFELDRAMASSGYAQLSSWAVKWGRMALEAIENPEIDPGEKITLEDELTQAEDHIVRLKSAIEDAVIELDQAMTIHKIAPKVVDDFNEIIGRMENAL